MLRRWVEGLSCIVLLFVGAGCGTSMAIDPGTTSLDLRSQSIGIFTLIVENNYHPGFGVCLTDLQTDSNNGSIHFRVGADWEGDAWPPVWEWMETKEFPISLGLAPGTYTVGAVAGHGTDGLNGWGFSFPMNTKFTLPPGSVVYLGHVTMSLRPKHDDEPSAGSVFPLATQAASGYGYGTMDVTVTDNSDTDIPKFVARFPCLKGVSITTAIMEKQ